MPTGYGKGKSSVYDKVAKNSIARGQLSQCGDSLDLKEEVVEELFKFTRHIIYGDKKSNTMAEARTAKWKKMKNKSFVCLPPDADSLRQHCLRANYLAYLVRHPSLKCHPSPLGHGWELVGGRCRPVGHTRSALPMHLPAPGPAAESEEDESEDDDDDNDKDLQMRRGIHQSLTIQRLSGPIQTSQNIYLSDSYSLPLKLSSLHTFPHNNVQFNQTLLYLDGGHFRLSGQNDAIRSN